MLANRICETRVLIAVESMERHRTADQEVKRRSGHLYTCPAADSAHWLESSLSPHGCQHSLMLRVCMASTNNELKRAWGRWADAEMVAQR